MKGHNDDNVKCSLSFKKVVKELFEELNNQFEEECEKIKKKINEKLKELGLDINTVNYNSCPDNYLGNFEIKENRVIHNNLWFDRKKRVKNIKEIFINDNKLKLLQDNKEEKIILIVLESPHKNEFKGIDGHIAPAIGKTGKYLNDYFNNIIKDKLGDGKYKVILSNAIQYQCSLGVNTNIFRDRIWIKLWLMEDFDKYFIKRLEKYKPDAIINLCTKGGHEKDPYIPKVPKVINKEYLYSICDEEVVLKKLGEVKKKIELGDLVQKIINKYSYDKDIFIFKGYHPSSWWNNRYRKID